MTSPKSIVYVFQGEWPKNATRVRKETQAMAARGHDITLVVRNYDRQPTRDAEPWMKIRRLPRFPGPLNKLLNFPLFFSPLWLWTIASAIRAARADLLVVVDVPVAPAGVILSKVFRIPLVFDMAEVYPEFLRGLRRHGNPGLLNRLLRPPWLIEFLERVTLKHADHTFVVSHESKLRAMELGVAEQDLTIVGNSPESPEKLREPVSKPEALKRLEGRRIALYVGIVVPDRGLPTTVRAMARVTREMPEAALVIVGNGTELDLVEAERTRLGLEDSVFLAGWQEHADLPGFYQHAHAGLLPFLAGGQIDYTLANKLFDYMAAGLPVVASDVPPMRRVLTELGTGRLARWGDPDSLAEAILEVLSLSEEDWLKESQKGIQGVQEAYAWAQDAVRLQDAVDGILNHDQAGEGAR
jgi:glycosyltransferase involved in cell wall biosynthesis